LLPGSFLSKAWLREGERALCDRIRRSIASRYYGRSAVHATDCLVRRKRKRTTGQALRIYGWAHARAVFEAGEKITICCGRHGGGNESCAPLLHCRRFPGSVGGSAALQISGTK